MKIELLKNKKTEVIEKIIIDGGILNTSIEDISVLNLKHEQILITLNAFDQKWHEKFVLFDETTNKLEFLREFAEDFELSYWLKTVLEHLFNNKIIYSTNKFEKWFFKYYLWTLFYKLYKTYPKLVKITDKVKLNFTSKIFDPMLLLITHGIPNLKINNVLYEDHYNDLNLLWITQRYQSLETDTVKKWEYQKEMLFVELLELFLTQIHYKKKQN